MHPELPVSIYDRSRERSPSISSISLFLSPCLFFFFSRRVTTTRKQQYIYIYIYINMHRIWGDTFSSPLRFSSCITNALLTLRIFLTTYFTYFSLPCYFYLLWLTLNTLTHERKTLKRDLSIILNAIIIIPSALIIYRPR